jgi:hypothetical protein
MCTLVDRLVLKSAHAGVSVIAFEKYFYSKHLAWQSAYCSRFSRMAVGKLQQIFTRKMLSSLTHAWQSANCSGFSRISFGLHPFCVAVGILQQNLPKCSRIHLRSKTCKNAVAYICAAKPKMQSQTCAQRFWKNCSRIHMRSKFCVQSHTSAQQTCGQTPCLKPSFLNAAAYICAA